VSSESYVLLKHIGKGAFANVHSAQVVDHASARVGTHVAIKIIDLEGLSSDLDDIRKEVATLRLCSYPNVLRYYVSFVEGRHLWLVTQLMCKGSCLHVMTQAKRLGLPLGMKEEWLGWILMQTLKALKYFHEQGQIHRDIKAGNILLDEKGRVTLADFGVSRWVNTHVRDTGTYQSTGRNNSHSYRAQTFVGTPCWMAPEVMEQLDGYDFKADIWSLGITALELAKGHAPYANHPPMKVLLYTIQNDPPSLKTYKDDKYGDEPFSQNFKQFVRMCLCKDPAKRPTCTTLLAHKFFTKEYSPESLVSELLDHVQDVNNETSAVHDSRSKAVDIAQLSQSYQDTKENSAFEDLDMEQLPMASAAAPETQLAGAAPQVAGAAGAAVVPHTQPKAPDSLDAQSGEQFWAFTEDAATIKKNFEIAKTLDSKGAAPPPSPGAAETPASPLPGGATAASSHGAGACAGDGDGDADPRAAAKAVGPAAAHDAAVHASEPRPPPGRGNDPSGVTELDDRSAQEAYAKKVGGLELYSEEEVNDKRAVARAADEEAHDEVLTTINEIMSQQGGEGRRIHDHRTPAAIGDSPR